MSEFIERLKETLKHEKMSREDLAKKTGMTFTRINNAMNKRGHFRAEEINQIAECFPDFEFWLHSGRERPEKGDVSPMTKTAQSDYREQEGG